MECLHSNQNTKRSKNVRLTKIEFCQLFSRKPVYSKLSEIWHTNYTKENSVQNLTLFQLHEVGELDGC